MVEQRNRLDRYLDIIHQVMAGIAGASILFMMLAISYAVALRFLWNQPVPWVVEVSSYLMLYITFLGTAWLLRKDGHVQIDLFTSKMAPRSRAIFDALTSIGGVLVGCVLTWKGALVTLDYYQRGVTAFGILNTPQFLLMAVIPVGGFFLMVEFVLKSLHSGKIALNGQDDEN